MTAVCPTQAPHSATQPPLTRSQPVQIAYVPCMPQRPCQPRLNVPLQCTTAHVAVHANLRVVSTQPHNVRNTVRTPTRPASFVYCGPPERRLRQPVDGLGRVYLLCFSGTSLHDMVALGRVYLFCTTAPCFAVTLPEDAPALLAHCLTRPQHAPTARASSPFVHTLPPLTPWQHQKAAQAAASKSFPTSPLHSSTHTD